jgi:hypothetical protein
MLHKCQLIVNCVSLGYLLIFYLFVIETGSGDVTQAGLELLILLPLFPKCWDYRPISLHLTSNLFIKFICFSLIYVIRKMGGYINYSISYLRNTLKAFKKE